MSVFKCHPNNWMAYLPVSLPSVHKLISCPHWSRACSCVLEEGLCKEVADFFRLCIFKFQRTRAVYMYIIYLHCHRITKVVGEKVLIAEINLKLF